MDATIEMMSLPTDEQGCMETHRLPIRGPLATIAAGHDELLDQCEVNIAGLNCRVFAGRLVYWHEPAPANSWVTIGETGSGCREMEDATGKLPDEGGTFEDSYL